MVYVIGASSLDNVKGSAIKGQLIRKIFSIRGLSFNHNAFNKGKVLQLLLQGGALKHANDIVIWHDVINNSVTEHRSNSKALSTSELIGILEQFKSRITAIIYTPRFRRPNLLKQLSSTGILVLDARKNLLSRRKSKSPFNVENLGLVHPAIKLEYKLLLTVLKHENYLGKLIKNRSQNKRPSRSQRKAGKRLREAASTL